ncbi:MAG: HAMP domain-containing histidine kinase [Burkholderiales bacterium]|nr:HAMP domain-containing histidine kinase [Burkholderiales bacterium]
MSRTGVPSIRRRLARVVVGISLAWSLAAFGVVWAVVYHQVDRVMDGALQESAEILFGLLHANAAQLPIGSGGSLPAPPHDEHLVWQLVAADGRVTWRSHRAPAAPLAAPLTGPAAASQVATDEGDGWHVHLLPFDSRGTVLVVAQRHADRRAARLKAATATASGALLVGLACAAWLRRRVRAELLPVLQLSRQVARYHPLEAAAGLPPATRAELVPLRDAVLHLGERLAQRVTSERAFSAHAAHALRTPLAGVGAQLALAQRESPPSLQPRLQRAREAADRLGRVVTALLTLFRSGTEPAWQSVDLVALLRSLPVEGLAVEPPVQPAPCHADPDLLAAALLNLLDNARRYGATRVQASIVQDGVLTRIRLADDGPGIDPGQRQRMQAALDSERYDDGLGLGLMLADRVARAHGGRLALLPAPAGFAVEMTLADKPGPIATAPLHEAGTAGG